MRLGVFLPFFPAQENPAKLSDQQEAVSQGQNPYPIYSAVNVRTNMTGEDFAGAWVYGPRKHMEAIAGGGYKRPGYRSTREPWSTVGFLPLALGKAKIPAQAQGPGGTLRSWWEALGDIPFLLGPQNGASSHPTRLASPNMGLMFPPSSLAQSSSWADC